MKKITVNASTSYEILVEKNLLASCGKHIKSVTNAEKIAVITDDNVDELYSEKVINSLKSEGFKVCKFVFKHGEAQKCSETLNDIYDFLVENEITRTDCIVALGGGVVGDISGYAAATYLRGIDFIQLPTTLLAQVDSSVGGKTAIDLPSGKNLVGAFKQPKLVLCDTDTLKSLSDDIFSDGMGEVVKYGMIKSSALFSLISSKNIRDDENLLTEVISQCISIKRDIVEADEFEKGERMLLNFGHTLGHAIEKAGNFTDITHGKAVGIGMSLMTEICEKNELCQSGTHKMLNNCLSLYNIPTQTQYNLSLLSDFCLNDKKRNGGNISIVICKEIGKSEVKKLTIDEFKALIR